VIGLPTAPDRFLTANSHVAASNNGYSRSRPDFFIQVVRSSSEKLMVGLGLFERGDERHAQPTRFLQE